VRARWRLRATKKGKETAVMKVKLMAAMVSQVAGQAFYNTSPFTLADLRGRTKAQQLKADFEAYLDGFSPNVQDILEKFRFRNQIPTLVEAVSWTLPLRCGGLRFVSTHI